MAKLIAEYRAEELTSAVAPYISLKEIALGMVCLSESHQGLNFCDVISVRRYSFYILAALLDLYLSTSASGLVAQ